MSLAVATMNTRERCSASRSGRRPAPAAKCRRRCHPRTAPSRSRPATGHRAQAPRRRSATRADSSPIRRATSNTGRRSPASPAAPRVLRRARAARLLPQPCTPNNITPLGASSPGALPSKAALRCATQRRRFFSPPMSANCAVSASNDRVPPRFNSWYLRRCSGLMSSSVSAPSLKMACRGQALYVIQWQAAQVVDQLLYRLDVDAWHRAVHLAHSRVVCITMAWRSSLLGRRTAKRAAGTRAPAAA